MKGFKFKSLTMRIWTTFTLIILIIILSISFFYLVAFKRIDEANKIGDLKVSHDMLLDANNFSQPNRFDELKNLKGSDYYIFNVDENNNTKIININMNKGHGFPAGAPKSPTQPFGINDDKVKIWMSSFITTD